MLHVSVDLLEAAPRRAQIACSVGAGRGEGSEVDPEQLGVVGDGWGEQRKTLEDFPWAKYGVVTGV